MYEYNAIVVRVVDGDTFICDIDLGFHIKLEDQWFRLYRINAPETTLRGETTPEEKAAGLALKAQLAARFEGQQVVLRTYKDDKGKYGRWLCEVIHNGENLNETMLRDGLVEPYDE